MLCDKFACTRNAASRVVEYDYCFFIPWTRSKMDEWARTEASRGLGGRPGASCPRSSEPHIYTHTHAIMLPCTLCYCLQSFRNMHLLLELILTSGATYHRSAATLLLLPNVYSLGAFAFYLGNGSRHLHESHLDAPRFSMALLVHLQAVCRSNINSVHDALSLFSRCCRR